VSRVRIARRRSRTHDDLNVFTADDEPADQ